MRVAIAVLIYQNQFLICERKEKYAGIYEFPGGKIEENESSLQAIQRELMEELNFKTNNYHYFKSYQNIIDGNHYELEVYYTFLEHNVIVSNVHRSLVFINSTQLSSYKTFNNVNIIIQDLQKEKIIY